MGREEELKEDKVHPLSISGIVTFILRVQFT